MAERTVKLLLVNNEPYETHFSQPAKNNNLLTRKGKGTSYSSTTSFVALTPALDFSNADCICSKPFPTTSGGG